MICSKSKVWVVLIVVFLVGMSFGSAVHLVDSNKEIESGRFVEKSITFEPQGGEQEPDGEGTQDEPYLITNIEELNWIRNDLDAYYELQNDIDASETEDWDGGNGWDPIGEYEPAAPFTGYFDGQGYEIKNLYMDRADEDVLGLFVKLDGGGEVKDLGLVDVDMVGLSGVGALAGLTREDAHIENSYVEGGSVVGVDDSDFSVGGFVGQHQGIITDCYASVSVSGPNLLHVGGLVGLHIGTIMNSYAAGQVDGGGSVGGLVGTNGAAANYPSGGSIYDSFSDEETTGQSVPIGDDQSGASDNVEAYPTSIMQTYDTYESPWDIALINEWDNHTWFINDGRDYPRLFYQIYDPVLTINEDGEGTTDPEPGTHTFEWNEEVTIEAMPDEGYRFNNWLGDYPKFEKYEDEITITMDSDKEVTAYFIEEEKRKWVVESQRDGSTRRRNMTV